MITRIRVQCGEPPVGELPVTIHILSGTIRTWMETHRAAPVAPPVPDRAWETALAEFFAELPCERHTGDC